MRILAALFVLAGLAAAQDESIFSKSFKGETPPEIEIAKENWLNAKEPPKLEKLKGRVVWLEFGFLG